MPAVAPANVVVQQVPITMSRYVDVLGNRTPYTVSVGTGPVTVLRDGLAKELRQLEADYNNQGGNAISAIEQSLENARVGLKLRQQVEESARKALTDAGLELQWSAAGWEQAHEHAAARSAELKDDSEALKELAVELSLHRGRQRSGFSARSRGA